MKRITQFHLVLFLLSRIYAIDFYADLLIWTAKEAGADNWAEVIVRDSTSSSNELRQVHFGVDPGIRVGVSFPIKEDSWEMATFYTWFHTVGKDAISTLPDRVHSTFLGNFYVNNPDGLNLSGPAYESAKISWTIDLNLFDLEIKRSFSPTDALCLSPFIGLKGGWIDQTIHSTWINPNLTGAAYFQKGEENLKNHFWGVGPSVGIETKWQLLNREHQLFLFGDFSGALLWGEWSFQDRFSDDLPETITVGIAKTKSCSPMARIFMGLGWKVGHFEAKLGYETQIFLNQLQFYSFTGGRLNNQLTLQGGTLALGLDF